MIEPPLPGASIDRGPQDWQILQRGPAGTASLKVGGVWRTEAPEYRVEVRLVRERDGAPVTRALDWQSAYLEPGERWSVGLEGIPAGGLYRLETRVWRAGCPDTRPMRGDYVHHLGVGDIWVIAGQSNASGTGTGYADDPPALGIHQLGNDEVWKLAAHPLEDATRTRHAVTVHGVFQAHSPWLAFGRRLQEALGVPIGLIPTALGGSPIARWQPGADLYRNLLDMVSLAGGRIRGVVWYQGESDCNQTDCAAYDARFRQFVEGLRRDLGAPDLPIVTAQLGRFASPDGAPERERAWTAMRETQRRLAREIPDLALVPTVDLPLCDEIHISAAADLVLGNRFADVALSVAYGHDLAAPGIALLRFVYDDQAPSLTLEFDRPNAGWCRVGSASDFTIEDAQGDVAVESVTPDDAGTVTLRLGRRIEGEGIVHAHAGTFPQPSLRDRDQRPIYAFSVPIRCDSGAL